MISKSVKVANSWKQEWQYGTVRWYGTPFSEWYGYGTLVQYASKIELKYGTLVRYGSRCEVRSTQIPNVPYRTAILGSHFFNKTDLEQYLFKSLFSSFQRKIQSLKCQKCSIFLFCVLVDSRVARGGAGGTMPPGPMDFWRPMGFRGAFFWRSPKFDRKTATITVKTFVFWRSHHISDETAAFCPSVLDFTKPKIRHIWAGPGTTFGCRRPWLTGQYER